MCKDKGSLYLDSIGIFWRTLVVSEDAYVNDTCEDATQQDYSYFDSLVHEVKQRDPGVVRYAAQFLADTLHPENTDIPEPNASPPRRGRPSIGRTTRRDPSGFEYGRPRGRSRVSSSTSGKGSRSSGRSGRTSTSYSLEGPLTSVVPFPWPDDVPTFIIPHITGWVDVVGDGNCGFRVVAEVGFGGENAWPTVRNAMTLEMQANMDQYLQVYMNDERGRDEAIFRIGGHRRGSAPHRHWIDTPLDLFSAATFLNCVFVNLATGRGPARDTMESCGTILPLRAYPGVTGPERVVGIAHVNTNHYVLVHLTDDCPLPPLIVTWARARCHSVHGWELPYAARFSVWRGLRQSYMTNDYLQYIDLRGDDADDGGE